MQPTARPLSTSCRIVSTRPPTVPRAPGLLQQPCRQLGALHPVPDALRIPAVARAAHPRVPRARPRQARRQARGLVLVQLGRRLAEVAAAGRLDAVHAGPEFYDIEVALEDPPLGQRALELPGQDGLARLAQRTTRGREPEILRQLLGDRRGAARELALLERLGHRLAHVLRGE